MKYLSVGIPAYNQAKFLGKTINSLLNQSVPASEIVVSDNHSTDETAQVLEQFKDKITIIRPPLVVQKTFGVSNKMVRPSLRQVYKHLYSLMLPL